MTVRHLATVFLFAPLFFQRAFIGGEGDSYKDYQVLGLSAIGYACHFGMILLPLFHPKLNRSQVNWTRVLLVFLFLGMWSSVHLFVTSEATGFSAIELAGPLLRGFVWLLAVTSYLCIYIDKKILIDVFQRFCRFSSWTSIICIVLYFLFNLPFGVIVDKGYPRVQGFFSEPSTLANVFPAFVLIGLLRKNYRDVGLGLIALLFSASVIVYISTIFVFIAGFTLQKGKTTRLTAFLSAFTVVVVLMPMILNKENSEVISRQAESLLNTYSSTSSADGLVFEVFISRVLMSLSTLTDVLSSYSPYALGSALARLIGPIVTIDELNQSGLYFFGFGLNIFGYISDQRYDGIMDFGLFPFLFSSFGIPAALVLFSILTYAIRRIALSDPIVGVLFLGNFFSVLINSAAGIHAYTLPVLALMASLFGTKTLFQRAKRTETSGG